MAIGKNATAWMPSMSGEQADSQMRSTGRLQRARMVWWSN